MGTEVPARIAVPVQPPHRSVGQHVGTSSPGSAMPHRIPKLFMRPVLIWGGGEAADNLGLYEVES
jgi:hypothetical protein